MNRLPASKKMSQKRPRVFGTTDEAISQAEKALGFAFPPSFRQWLLNNNGRQLEYVTIKPVFDERDPRSTFDSLVREFQLNWLAWLENFEEEKETFEHLLPFSPTGSGDYYCFDYSRCAENGECPVVFWSHETGECQDRAANFEEFLEAAAIGSFEFD